MNINITQLSVISLSLAVTACATGNASTGDNAGIHRFGVKMQVVRSSLPMGEARAIKGDVLGRITYRPAVAAALSESRKARFEKLAKFVLYDPTLILDANAGDALYKVEVPSLKGDTYCSVDAIGTFGGQPFIVCFTDRERDNFFDTAGLTHALTPNKGGAHWGAVMGTIVNLNSPLSYEKTNDNSNLPSGDITLTFDGKSLERDLDWDTEWSKDAYFLDVERLKNQENQILSFSDIKVKLLEFTKNESIVYKITEQPKIGSVALYYLDVPAVKFHHN